MKSQAVRSFALTAVAALLACTSGGLDEASRDGSSDSKSLSVPAAQAPAFHGGLGLKNSHSPRGQLAAGAPTGAHLTNYGGNVIEHPTYTNVYWGAFWTSGSG